MTADTRLGDSLTAVRRLYASKFDVPQALREGAIAHRFGSADVDAIHAARLKAVQNAAFLRAAWMSTAVASDLDTGDPRPRWAMFVNGVVEDLQAARTEAAQAGVDSRDIDHADKIGSSGLTWDQQPAHRLLGRLEDLSQELYHHDRHAIEHQDRIRNLSERLETAEAAIEALSRTVAQQDISLSELVGEVVDHHWSITRPDSLHEPESLAKLREANAMLAAANALDTLDAPQSPDGRVNAGTEIGTAVDLAMTGIDPPATTGPILTTPPIASDPAPPESEPEP
ncbi:hypothetical protein ACFXO9_26770 [Nocardia tengchongensis]|uniref:hypothetical protein n=1 Tax=Nocardia tengchongensis TaxID=2055889 RepID=UPI00367F094E